MDASRGRLKSERAFTSTVANWLQSQRFWGLTAHGLFILRCSNYLVMLELTILA